jgi:polynucleotide 5'-hydroxyl-kinase GRC3/NOL9
LPQIFSSDDVPKYGLVKELSSPGEWNKKLAQLTAPKPSSPPRILICGPKSSGKSTFSRMMANRFVTHHVAPRSDPKDIPWNSVAYMDIDPGQPEFTPPGVIALVTMSKPNLGSSFCHPAVEAGFRVVKSHAIASVTPALDPVHLVDCATDMFTGHYNPDGAKHPLIVNTPGWVQGTGLDIITTLIKHVQPTEVIYMSRDGPEETVEHLKTFCGSIPFTTLPSQASEYTSRTALHYRTMQTMSYFHLKPPSLAVKYHAWDPTPLTEIPPFRVQYRGADRGLLGLLCYDYQPHPSLLAESVNGMLVALVVINDPSAIKSLLPTPSSGSDDIAELEETLISSTPEGIPFFHNPNGRSLQPEHSETIGLALIRGIDVERGELQLLTPLADTVMSKFGKEGRRRLILVAGKFDTPSWAYTEDLYRKAYGTGTSQAAAGSQEVTVADEDTDDDASEGDHEEDVGPAAREYTEAPWVEMLHGNQKRSVGSRVWRVRRDLGKG